MAGLADRIASRVIPWVLAASLVTGIAWWLAVGDVATAIERAVAVLVVACPCAIGLAAPTAVLVGTGRAARRGVVFANGHAIEALAAADTVVLDKTGTLTSGEPRVVAVEGDVLALAAAVEAHSEHPIGRAITRAAPEPRLAVSDFRSHPGRGVEGVVDGRRVELRAAPPSHGSLTRVEVLVEGVRTGSIALSDLARPEAPGVVAELAGLGLAPWIASGDAEGPVSAVADEVGVEAWRAAMLPDGKVTLVEDLARSGRRVAMVGDGVNDAPALAAASVGVAMGGAADLASDTAGVVLMGSDLTALPDAVRMARSIVRTIRANLGWAVAYNALAVPLAAGAFGPLAMPSPMLASAAMALSSVSVVLISLRSGRP